MPSPIGSTEWNTDDDRMSTGHSVHTGSRSETETRQKPSDRAKGTEEEETPKLAEDLELGETKEGARGFGNSDRTPRKLGTKERTQQGGKRHNERRKKGYKQGSNMKQKTCVKRV